MPLVKPSCIPRGEIWLLFSWRIKGQEMQIKSGLFRMFRPGRFKIILIKIKNNHDYFWQIFYFWYTRLVVLVSSFFKQEGDKLKDDDLYKHLQDLKKAQPKLKQLKTIKGKQSESTNQNQKCFTYIIYEPGLNEILSCYC